MEIFLLKLDRISCCEAVSNGNRAKVSSSCKNDHLCMLLAAQQSVCLVLFYRRTVGIAHNSSYLFMHVSCPMVLVINPIASSTTMATAAATLVVSAAWRPCGGNKRWRRSGGGRRLRWEAESRLWSSLAAAAPFNLERHGSMQIISIAQVETYGQYQSMQLFLRTSFVRLHFTRVKCCCRL